jgi:thymidylate synthase
MQPYDDALQEILDRGIKKADRTGVGCISVAGIQKKYRLDTEYFPLVTGRRLFPKSVFAELLWFISGSTMNQDLEALGAKFWGKWCDENNPKYVEFRKKWGYEPGDFGPIYGWQLRHFGVDYLRYRAETKDYFHLKGMYNKLQDANRVGDRERFLSLLEGDDQSRKVEGIRGGYISEEDVLNVYEQKSASPPAGGFDQLAWMVDVLKNDRFGSQGRRCLFSLWNPNDLDKMALPPCHYTYQAIADGDGGLTGILTQRSCDFPVGVPANIQFYSALTIMLAQQVDLKPREFIHNTNDSHIYLNQIDQVKEYLAREKPASPKLSINKAADIFSYKMEDFVVFDYNPNDKIDIPVAV